MNQNHPRFQNSDSEAIGGCRKSADLRVSQRSCDLNSIAVGSLCLADMTRLMSMLACSASQPDLILMTSVQMLDSHCNASSWPA